MYKLFQRFIVALAFVLGTAPAFADDISTRVIVPDAPGGALVAGCYRAQSTIYKGYRLSFCLEQRGTYRVVGGGVTCSGRLSWRGHGGYVSVQLQRTPCGNGVAWSADSMTCRPQGLFLGIIGKVLVPDFPNLTFLGGLRCDYEPAKGTRQKPTTFTARRYS